MNKKKIQKENKIKKEKMIKGEKIKKKIMKINYKTKIPIYFKIIHFTLLTIIILLQNLFKILYYKKELEQETKKNN